MKKTVQKSLRMKKTVIFLTLCIIATAAVLAFAACDGGAARIRTAEAWQKVIDDTNAAMSPSDANFAVSSVTKKGDAVVTDGAFVVDGSKGKITETKNDKETAVYLEYKGGLLYAYAEVGGVWTSQWIPSSSGAGFGSAGNFIRTQFIRFDVFDGIFDSLTYSGGVYTWTIDEAGAKEMHLSDYERLLGEKYTFKIADGKIAEITAPVVLNEDSSPIGRVVLTVTFGGQSVTLPVV